MPTKKCDVARPWLGHLMLYFVAFWLGVGATVLWEHAVPAVPKLPAPPPPPPVNQQSDISNVFLATASTTNKRYCWGFVGSTTYADIAFNDIADNGFDVSGIIYLWHYSNGKWSLTDSLGQKFGGIAVEDPNGSILMTMFTYADPSLYEMMLTSKWLSVLDSSMLKGFNVAADNTAYSTRLDCSRNQRR